ncbi:MAG TPA: hypothetical protein VLA19_29155 [Herpetosiphonaceae bacterium]|nr:hypothetical protein [Herpetosiphonaceae bacterium]
MDRLSELLGQHVQFAYTAWDRIVLNGYLDRLQRPENLVYFFREVVGVPSVTPEVLMSRTAPYRAGIIRYAEEHGIPLLGAAKDVRKEELVAPYYGRFTEAEGVVCILTSVEQGRTFVSYTPRYAPPSGDPHYRLISACRKRFLHYYFYLLDPILGPMSLRVGTFLPFTLACFLNGHSFLARELTRAGVAFRKDDNAFLAVADVAALEAAAERLTPRLIEQRCDHWARRLAPSFSPAERAALPLGYRYSVAQIELATDLIFKRSAPLKALFRRATELGILLGGADRTTHLFGRRITARYGGKLQTVLDRRNEGQPILRSYYGSSFVKQYEKGDRLLRTETCLNNTYDLGIGRRLDNLPVLKERMLATNTRYLDAQAEVLASTVDGGALASLARPVPVGARRVPGLKLEDDRVIRLLEGLLHPGTFVADWTTREVHARLLARHRLTEADYRPGQLRYDLGKLRAHGLVERLGTSRRYRLTPRGLKLGVLLVKLRTRLLGPLASLASEQQPRRSTRHPSDVEAAFRQVDAALDHLCDTLGLKLVA